ncbi:MAG: hypothetical protein JXC33_00165 [Deltaproteobacteria bacterium]|nr:hypothetical protein [Deltaproteobacteria bacterium]
MKQIIKPIIRKLCKIITKRDGGKDITIFSMSTRQFFLITQAVYFFGYTIQFIEIHQIIE